MEAKNKVLIIVEKFCKTYKHNWSFDYNEKTNTIIIRKIPTFEEAIEFNINDVKNLCIESAELCIGFKDRTMFWLVGYEPKINIDLHSQDWNPLLDERD